MVEPSPHQNQRQRLQLRLRALLGLCFVLLPAVCSFPLLAVIATGMLRWLALTVWLVMGVAFGWLALRALRTYRALNHQGEGMDSKV
jgi:uncharacterized membrane protein